jgi:hypothetical protein
MNYSVTQTTNYASIAMTIGIMVRIFTDSSSVTPEEWQVVGLAVFGLIATAINAINRHSKGDMTGLITKE